MTKRLKNSRGQFLPIAAMVTFTIVVFIFAVINIYRVAKTKLRLQNIADAVALNLAAREASSLNFVADRNEWLNHLYADESLNTDPNSPKFTGCGDLSNQKRLPGLSCVDLHTSNFSFPSNTGAAGYARLVQAQNQAQMLAAQAYDTFLGAGGAGSGVGQKALQDILLNDIPDLRNDPTIRLITWNSQDKARAAEQELNNAQNNAADYFSASKPLVKPLMDGLSTALTVQDIQVRYDGTTHAGAKKYGYYQTSFSQLLKSKAVGWMEVNQNYLPKLNLSVPGNTTAQRIGAGAIVLKPVTILGVTFAVSARSVAYVVPQSGSLPVYSNGNVTGLPVFAPTFWVKLVNSRE